VIQNVRSPSLPEQGLAPPLVSVQLMVRVLLQPALLTDTAGFPSTSMERVVCAPARVAAVAATSANRGSTARGRERGGLGLMRNPGVSGPDGASQGPAPPGLTIPLKRWAAPLHARPNVAAAGAPCQFVSRARSAPARQEQLPHLDRVERGAAAG